MKTDLIYTEQIPFRIEQKQRKKQEYQDFFFTKIITNYFGKNGKLWQQTGFLTLQIIGVIAAILILDLPLLFGRYVLINLAKLLYSVTVKGIELILELIFKTILGKVIFEKFIAPILRWFAIILVLFTVFYLYHSDKWIIIYNYLNELWAYLPLDQ